MAEHMDSPEGNGTFISQYGSSSFQRTPPSRRNDEMRAELLQLLLEHADAMESDPERLVENVNDEVELSESCTTEELLRAKREVLKRQG